MKQVTKNVITNAAGLVGGVLASYGTRELLDKVILSAPLNPIAKVGISLASGAVTSFVINDATKMAHNCITVTEFIKNEIK